MTRENPCFAEQELMNNLAPIALFVYNRPDHFRRTIEHLAANRLAGASELFIFSDGPRSGSDVSRIESVREIARSVSGFRRISVLARTQNLGLANSIITGVTEIHMAASSFSRMTC